VSVCQRVFPASFAARSWMSTNALPSMAKSSAWEGCYAPYGESQVMNGISKIVSEEISKEFDFRTTVDSRMCI